MAFLRRLGWYLVGLSIGIVFLVFFLKRKSGENGFEICYFPNCRVLKDMKSKPLTFEENLPEQYRDSVFIASVLAEGDIDFGESDTKSEPCKTYSIDYTYAEKEWVLKTKNCPEELVILSVTPRD